MLTTQRPHIPPIDDFRLELTTTLSICKAINTPKALSIYLLIQAGEWDQIINQVINPNDYVDKKSFQDDYLCMSLLRKSQLIPSGIDTEAKALDTFIKSEAGCEKINLSFLDGSIHLSEYLDVKEIVRTILGPLSKRTLTSVWERCRFGPGATTCIRGKGSIKSDKFRLGMDLTIEMLPYYKSLIGDTGWYNSLPAGRIVDGNTFTTVPKSATTRRGICIEPTLNSFLQLGIGRTIREKLKSKLGINLQSQQRNQTLSRLAFSRRLATIDLSAASDSISYELVKALLPWEWFNLLSICRSETTTLPDGTKHANAKFSSMGNGYTFELESMLFAAIAYSCVPCSEWNDIAVYGDDLIVPQAYADGLIKMLNRLGFSVNGTKSFLDGSFFESCGTDWFQGQNVRPFFLDRDVIDYKDVNDANGSIPYALQIANKLRLYSKRVSGDFYCDPRFRPTWRDLVKKVPKSWRNKGPESLGDSVLITSFSEAKSALRSTPAQYEGWRCKYKRLKPKTCKSRTFGFMYYAIAGAGGSSRGTIANYWYLSSDAIAISLSEFARQGVTSTFSYGREPIRGVFAQPVQAWTNIPYWSEGFSWGPPTEICPL